MSGATTDFSPDGNSHHKNAVGGLSNGWNPVWQSIADFNQSSNNPFVVPDAWPLWNDWYTKATWIFGASGYQLTGTIEAGKAFNLLLIAAVFLLGAGYLGQRFGPLRGTVLGAVLALNPVALAQVFSFYVDGALGGLLILLMLLLTMLLDRSWDPPQGWRLAYWPTVAATIIVLSNVKFTGLFYAGIAGIVYLAALLLRPRRNREQIKALSITGTVAAVLAVGLVGASSYIRNTVNFGNPLYPLAGANSVDILTPNQPADFGHVAQLSRFVWANLSPSYQLIGPDGGPLKPLKVPFSVGPGELGTFNYPGCPAGWLRGVVRRDPACFPADRHRAVGRLRPVPAAPICRSSSPRSRSP